MHICPIICFTRFSNSATLGPWVKKPVSSTLAISSSSRWSVKGKLSLMIFFLWYQATVSSSCSSVNGEAYNDQLFDQAHIAAVAADISRARLGIYNGIVGYAHYI